MRTQVPHSKLHLLPMDMREVVGVLQGLLPAAHPVRVAPALQGCAQALRLITADAQVHLRRVGIYGLNHLHSAGRHIPASVQALAVKIPKTFYSPGGGR